MNKNEHNSMKLRFFQNQSSLKKFTFVLKALVVFILSVLLVAPTPVLALVNTETLHDYAASVQSEINGLLQSIENLPSQSNDEAFKTLASIETSIVRLSDNAAKRAEEFQSRSDEYQKKLSQLTDNINTIYQEQQKLNSDIEKVNSELTSVMSLQTSTQQEVEKSQREYDRMQEEYNRKTRGPDIEDAKTLIPFYGWYYAGKRIYEGFDAGVFSSLKEELNQRKELLERLKRQMNELEDNKRIKSSQLFQAQEQIKVLKYNQEKLEIEKKALAAGVVFASNISVTCNSLKPKLFKAKNRIQDLRNTAEYFKGFNNSGEELMELKNSISRLADSASGLDIYIN
jgi:chromosome segregation ATPase